MDVFKGKMKMDESFDYSHLLTMNYLILGLHKKTVEDEKGDIIRLELYREYDEASETHTKLAVLEERTYIREATTGILIKRSTDHKWYDPEGNLIARNDVVPKFYTFQKGFKANKRARQNLIDKASMTLLLSVGVDNTKAFWKTLGPDDVKDYRNIGDLAIVNSINTSTESYMTAGVKATVAGILNIVF